MTAIQEGGLVNCARRPGSSSLCPCCGPLRVIGEAIKAYPNDLTINSVPSWPGQAVLWVSQVCWTKDIHEAINSGQKVINCLLYLLKCILRFEWFGKVSFHSIRHFILLPGPFHTEGHFHFTAVCASHVQHMPFHSSQRAEYLFFSKITP